MIRFQMFAVFLFGWIIAASQDSLVYFNEIQYQSDFERQAFKEYFKNNNPKAIVDLLLSPMGDGPSKRQAVVNQIESTAYRLHPSVAGKKPEKHVKIIYDQVHSTFLKKYELVNRFSEIFTTGNYNCVTATALYALVFDELKIPYAIQEKPTHVFLVAYPKQSNILVETTSPLFGYMSYDNRYKEKFVHNLKGSKLIGTTEAAAQTVDELFNKYFFQNDNIDLKKLVGLHYLNDALFKNDNQNVKEAFQQSEKAYLFYPSPRTSFLLAGFAAELLHQGKLKPEERAWMIAKISRHKDQNITKEMVRGEFINLTQQVLVKENNRRLYQECKEILLKRGIQEPETTSDIRYVYNHELGLVNYNQGNYEEAKYFFANALAEQPNNVESGATFVTTLAFTLRNQRNGKLALDTLQKYQTRFQLLNQNNKFNSLLALAWLMAYKSEMVAGNIKVAEPLLVKFEDMYKSNKNLLVDPNAVGSAYSEACSYYFKKGQKEKAKAFLTRGLEIAPDNFELRTRQQMIR
jgi:tetratricopeptide (TPR) repeat protein